MPYTAELLATDPLAFSDRSIKRLHTVPRKQLYDLQLEALQMRFRQLRDKIPMLKKLADRQGITEINEFDDALPLLFEHVMYKSYPRSFLEENRFDQLTNWLGKLTTIDISKFDAKNCKGVGDWFAALDAHTPLCPVHSSSTTGVMSFIPISKQEYQKFAKLVAFDLFGDFKSDEPFPEGPVGAYVIFPSYESGNSVSYRMNEFIKETIMGSDAKFFPAFPGALDSDILLLAGRIRMARQNGQLDRLKVAPELLARKDEVEAFQKQLPEMLKDFLARVVTELKGKRVYFAGPSPLLFEMAQAGLAKGLRGVFAPNSVVNTGGGAKGMVLPDNWREMVAEFFGVESVREGYGMTEVLAQQRSCEHGRLHIAPTNILYVIDPDTSKPLPRKGVVTGRAAFYDLAAETHWGGFITGDQVTVDWDTMCPCGRTTPHIDPLIQRYSEVRGGDDKITCAATETAHREAMDFLSGYAVDAA